MVGSVPGGATEQQYQAPGPGEVLAGKYRVESILGIGGMGVVLAVEHIELGQGMAVKLMLPGSTDERAGVARFLREARAAAGLQSEHVVRIFDVGTLDNGAPYMVMELLRGEDLSQVLASGGPLPVEEAVDYLLQACHAVSEAHARNIVHRDLKPSNLFLARKSDGTPHVKVLDFGISKALSPGRTPLVSQNLTATSAVMGSPLYMSPEQVRNAKYVDVRSDIWSLGVILHELLTGLPAFQADTLPGICAAIIADPVLPLLSIRPEAPIEIEAIIMKCLEKDAARRYQTVDDLVEALRPYASEQVRSSLHSVLTPATRLPRNPARQAPNTQPSPTPVAGVGQTDGAQGPATADPPTPSRAFAHHPGTSQSTKLSAGGEVSTAATPVTASHAVLGSTGRARLVGLALAAAAAATIAAVTILSLRRPTAAPTPVATPTPSASTTASGRATFELAVESTPNGARVLEGNVVLGATPMTLAIDNAAARTAPRRLVVERDGYLPYAIVQGPSEQNVRLIAPLAPIPAASGSEAVAFPGHPAGRARRAGDAKPAAATPSALTPAPAAPTPVAPGALPTDIRLER